jgi:hypothetical protein
MRPRLAALVLATVWITFHGVAFGQDGGTLDGRDALLAALGRATLDCVGTVGPSTYETRSGALERTFTACVSGDRTLLQRVDALLAVQSSRTGRGDDIAGHYVARWNAFTDSFPHGRIAQCPTWQLEGVIDAPTSESVPRFQHARTSLIGKENYRYRVESPQCAQDGECDVRLAAACAGGFGPAFIVDLDPPRSRVEVDPAWWLTTYDYPDDLWNPFKLPGYYHPMSYYGALPGALYGAIQRAGEACSQWEPTAGKHYTDRELLPIDCGGGWFCMTYCTLGKSAQPSF